MLTAKNVCEQIRNELFSNLFNGKTKEYLSFMGFQIVNNEIEFPPPSNSLISKKVHDLSVFEKSKVENEKRLTDAYKEDEYTGLVVQFYSVRYVPSRITLLNKNIARYDDSDDSKTINLVGYEKINDIGIVRFNDSKDNFCTLFIIKPRGPAILYAVNRTGRDVFMQIVKPAKRDSSKILFWYIDEILDFKLTGVFDVTNTLNKLTISERGHGYTVYSASGNMRDILLSKIDKTYLGETIKLLHKTLAKQYREYITEIFTSPEVAQKLFGGSIEPRESERINKRVKYCLTGPEDNIIADPKGTVIAKLKRHPVDEKYMYFELNANNTPYAKQNVDVTGHINAKTKEIELHLHIPIPSVKENALLDYDFDLSIDRPQVLTNEKLGIYYTFEYISNEDIVAIHDRSNFDEKIERRLLREVAARFTGLLASIDEKSEVDTYSL